MNQQTSFNALTLQPAIPKYRWTICALVFFATTVNYLDRSVISLMKSELSLEFHWDSCATLALSPKCIRSWRTDLNTRIEARTCTAHIVWGVTQKRTRHTVNTMRPPSEASGPGFPFQVRPRSTPTRFGLSTTIPGRAPSVYSPTWLLFFHSVGNSKTSNLVL